MSGIDPIHQHHSKSLESKIIRSDEKLDKSYLKAKTLLASGHSVAFVAQATGLPLTTIMRLKQDEAS